MADVPFTYGHRQRASKSALLLALKRGEMGVDAESGDAWLRTHDDYYTRLTHAVSPLAFGAKFDDSIDDAPGIIAAIAYAQTLGRAVILPGTAYIRTPITFSRPSSGESRFELIGLGQKESAISVSASVGSPISAMLKLETGFGSIEDLRFSDFRLLGNSLANIGLDLYDAYTPDCRIDRLRISGTLEAATKTKTYNINFTKCIARSNSGDGFWFEGDENNGVTLDSCGAYANDGVGIKIKGGNTLNIVNCTIEGNKQCGIFAAGPMRGLNITGNYFEGNGTVGYDMVRNVTNVTVHADVIINGGHRTNFSRAFPSTTITIIGNSHNAERTADGKAEYAYYLISAMGAIVKNNRHIAAMGSNCKLIGATYSVGESRLENLECSNNVGFSVQTALTYTGLSGGTFTVGEYVGVGSGSTFTALGQVLAVVGSTVYLENCLERSVFSSTSSLVSATLSGTTFTAGSVTATATEMIDHEMPVWLTDSVVDSTGNTMRVASFTCGNIPKKNYFDEDPRNLTWETSQTSSIDVAITGSTAGADTIQTASQSLQTGDKVNITLTGGSAGGVVSAAFDNAYYYWIAVDSTNGKIATSYANALAGTAVDITADIGAGTIRPYNGEIVLSSEKFHGASVYTIRQKRSTVTLSGRVKLSVDLDNSRYLHLRGKLVYFSYWVKQSATGMGPTVRLNSIFNRTSGSYSTAFGWRQNEHVVVMPYTGTVNLFLQFTAPATTAAWDISFAHPVLSEVGVPYWAYEDENSASTTKRRHTSQGADVASANDLTLGNDGNFFRITGTTTINRIMGVGWQPSDEVQLLFTGALTVTHRATDASGGGMAPLNLSGSVNLTTAANTRLRLLWDGSEWFEVSRTVA